MDYQQVSVAAMKNGLYKAPLHMILDQPTMKRNSRNYKNLRTNLEASRKNAKRNHQQTNRPRDILLYQINLSLISDESTTVQVLGMHLEASELLLTEKIEFTKISKNILKDGKIDLYAMKMTVFCDVKKKSENKNMEQLKLIYFENSSMLKLIYFENSYKCTETWLPLAIILQTKIILNAEEVSFKQCQENLGSMLVLKTVKQQRSRRKQTVIRMMTRKKCKSNTERVFASAKEKELFRENTNVYSKDQYKMFMEGKQIYDKRKGQHNGFKKDEVYVSFQEKSNTLIRKKMAQKCKTSKKYVENHRFLLICAFTRYRQNYNTQKIFLTQKTILFHIKKPQQPIFKRKTKRKKKSRKKHCMIFIAIRESKSTEIEMEISFELCHIQPSVINNNFVAIISDEKIRDEVFILEVKQIKSSVYTIELLKHLMQTFQKVNRYFSVAQRVFRNSVLKVLEGKKHLSTKSSRSMSHLRKHIGQGPSVVERIKRSTKEENVQVSLGRFHGYIYMVHYKITVFKVCSYIQVFT